MAIKISLLLAMATLFCFPHYSFSETQTIVDSIYVPAKFFDDLLVECPEGTIALGGGVDVDNVYTMAVTSSGPLFDKNGRALVFQPDGSNPAPIGWRAAVRNDNSSVDQEIKVASICAPMKGITTEVASTTVSPGTSNGVSAFCPSGTFAIGGGVDLDNIYITSVTSSAPIFNEINSRLLYQLDGIDSAPVGWRATAFNDGSSDYTIKVAAVCAPLATLKTSVDSSTVSAWNFNAIREQCPEGGTAFGGGIDVEDVDTMMVTSSAPTFDQNFNRLIFQPDGVNPAPIGWQASAVNGDTGEHAFKTAAICMPAFPWTMFIPVITGQP